MLNELQQKYKKLLTVTLEDKIKSLTMVAASFNLK